MYIVYLFSPHIDTFHIAMITSDGKYVFKKSRNGDMITGSPPSENSRCPLSKKYNINA